MKILNGNKDKISKALKLKKEEKFEEALEILNDLHKSKPNSKDIKNALIEVLFEYGAYLNDDWVSGYEKAVECFNRIIEIDGNHYKAWYNLGIAFFKLKETEKALEAYNQALKIKPDYEYIYYNIGLLYEVDKEDLETALKYYEEALRLNENFTYALQAMRDVRQKLEYIKLNKQKKDVSDFETQIICKKCGNINRASAKFCDECGESIH